MNNAGDPQLTPLAQAIVKTVAFFDIFDYPLTSWEIYKWLWRPDSSYHFLDIMNALAGDGLGNCLGHKHGFYFLFGRSIIVRVRLDRYLYAEKKFAIARRAMQWLRLLPFIQTLAVCNNVGFSNGSANSDIDVIIIVRPGRLWLTRFLVTITLTLARIRRHGRQVTNRICLSFYLTDDALNIAAVALEPLDPYLVYWFATLSPIYGQSAYEKFLAANPWLKIFLPNLYPTKINPRRFVADTPVSRFVKSISERLLSGSIGDIKEKFFRFVQLQKMARNTVSAAAQPNTDVIISDAMLKFHEKDRRRQYHYEWQSRLRPYHLTAE